jgi:hypothetical protein
MTIYWLLFAFPAIMALAYPVRVDRSGFSLGQGFAFLVFLIFYTLVAALRFETGGDWETYLDIFNEFRFESFGFVLVRADPVFGVINWLSAQLGTGIYLVYGICSWVLGYGAISVATRMREPWLALTIAVPYLLIVVGMGYVRQGAAIGMILLALAALDRGQPVRTILYLLVAIGFHSAAAIALPLFLLAFARRNVVVLAVFVVIGILAYYYVLEPRLELFEAGYITAEYDSSGALPRIMMGLVPAVLVLVRWKHFPASGLTLLIWLAVALANVAALVALILSPSSTAVDRVALFFSIIQLAAFGEIRDLTGVSDRMTFFMRLLLIGIAALVQVVWLVFATHSYLWVPYTSIFEG